MAQLVAHHTGSVGVTGSSPVSSTEWKAPGSCFEPGGFVFRVNGQKCVCSEYRRFEY